MVFSYRPPKKRKEIKLFTRESSQQVKEEQEIVYALHRELSGNRADENMEQILNFFKRTKNNKEFIQLMKQSLLKK